MALQPTGGKSWRWVSCHDRRLDLERGMLKVEIWRVNLLVMVLTMRLGHWGEVEEKIIWNAEEKQNEEPNTLYTFLRTVSKTVLGCGWVCHLPLSLEGHCVPAVFILLVLVIILVLKNSRRACCRAGLLELLKYYLFLIKLISKGVSAPSNWCHASVLTLMM